MQLTRQRGRSLPTFLDKLKGALYGLAVGDGMGAPVEGWPSQAILERFGERDLDVFLPPTHGGDPHSGKGGGRITDDTLMTEALISAYASKQDHMDAYDFLEYFVPEFAETMIWIPERQREMVLLDRLNVIEHYTAMRLRGLRAYPRHAGIGNVIDCGVAMYFMPVGAINAGHSHAAFQEAVSLAMAESDSYAVEAAATLAVAYAVALTPDAKIADVCDAALGFACDGTSGAIRAVLQACDIDDDLEDFINKTRYAFTPYDRTPQNRPEKKVEVNDCSQASRTLSIEELPVALAALKYGDGDFFKTIRASVFYGRDCDTIAGMACGLYGATYGVESLPAHLRAASDSANRRDFGGLAESFARVVSALLEKDELRLARRRQSVTS